jgi:hypothetical protein
MSKLTPKMPLCRKVINLVWLYAVEEVDEACCVSDIAVVQEEPDAANVPILIQMVDPPVLNIEARRMMLCTS